MRSLEGGQAGLGPGPGAPLHSEVCRGLRGRLLDVGPQGGHLAGHQLRRLSRGPEMKRVRNM